MSEFKEMNLHERIGEIRHALGCASAKTNDPWIAYALKHLDHLEIDVRILHRSVSDECIENHGGIRYNFPMLNFTREQCEKILRANGLEIIKTGCYFCAKQPREAWVWLKETHPDLYQECEEMGWLTKLPHTLATKVRSNE